MHKSHSYKMTRSLQRQQILAFSVSWFAFASTYLLRKPLGIIKSDLQDIFSFDETQLGWFDTALLFPYATVQIFLGPLANQFGTKTTLTLCLTISSLSMIGFGAVSNFYGFLILLFINGTAQSLTWPCAVKVVSSWYRGQTQNFVMGIFGTSGYAGGIMGAALAVYFQNHYGWKTVYFVPSLIVFIVAVMVFFVLDIAEDSQVVANGKQSSETDELNPRIIETRISWFDLWKIPAVLDVGLAIFCLKIVRYCMYMWLPMYLYEKNGYSKGEAGLFSTLFEAGGMLGCITIGFVIDKYFKGDALFGTAASAFLSALMLALFFLTSSFGLLFNTVLLLISGALSCGPDAMLGASIPMELGKLNGQNAGLPIVGLVNGLGSAGTFLEGPIIGYIIYYWNWDGMAFTLIVLSVMGSFYCLKAALILKKETLKETAST